MLPLQNSAGNRMGAKQEGLVGSTYHWFWLQLPFALAPPSGSLPTFYPISSIERQPIGHLEMPFVICSSLVSFRSYLDLVKVILFRYHFWFVLCLIFMTGTTRINIFCVGYLLACFYFMRFGQSLQLKPVKDILRLWDYLIAYTALVIAAKNLLAVCICQASRG